MTKLSVNINKIALLRNARGHDSPNVRQFSERCLDLGAHGITLHPRPDQRHAKVSDIGELQNLCLSKGAELNIEGNPTPDFLAHVIAARPAQCTLVPDSPGQLTSDHGWRIRENAPFLREVIRQLNDHCVRTSLFVDFDDPELEMAREIGADRVELYTEPYAAADETEQRTTLLDGFRKAAEKAQNAGLGVNAGHDLSLENLAVFLQIPHILEVSVGHALVVECLELGLPTVIALYLRIVQQAVGE